MNKFLSIARGIKFPSNAVTEKMAFLGKTNSGKTYSAMKVSEEMLKIDAQIIVLDPVGKWYGLQTLKNGKRGFSIPVFGGLHGDIPLQSTSGILVADLIVDKNISAVLDVSQFETDTEKTRFATDFSARLFFRKKASPSPLHLFIEECQEFIPQVPQKGEERMLHNFQRIWKIGRNFGIGGSLISQRPQEINKKALNQTECIFSFQMTGPHEKKAIEDWVGAKGFEEKENVKDLLPKLKNGECYLWSPVWLDIVQLIKVDEKETIDISATPKLGQKAIKPAKLSSSELAEIKNAMAETIQHIQENDPDELKKKIKELEKQLRQKNTHVEPVKMPADTALIKELKGALNVMDKNHKDVLHIIRGHLNEVIKQNEIISHKAEKAIEYVNAKFKEQNPVISSLLKHKTEPIPVLPKPKKDFIYAEIGKRQVGRTKEVLDGIQLGKCERNILIVLAQKGEQATKNQVAILSGYSIRSGSFNNSLGKLNTSAFIKKNGDVMEITQEGISALGEFDPLPTGEELQKYWINELGKAESAILQVLCNHHPNAITKEQIAEECEYAVTSGSFLNSLGKLRTLELAEGKKEIKASDSLFD